jgi:hypothetical protein
MLPKTLLLVKIEEPLGSIIFTAYIHGAMQALRKKKFEKK